MFLCIDKLDDATQNHVNRCGEKRRPEEKEKSLDNIGTQSPIGGLVGVECSCYIPDSLNFESHVVRQQLLNGSLRLLQGHLPRQPTTKGTKYHVFALTSWKVCMAADRINTTANTIAAGRDGS